MSRTPSSRITWLDRGLALALVVVTTLLLGATSDMGFTRDESFYFRYAELYQTWFTQVDDALEKDAVGEALKRETVDNIWRNNFEHPPLMKVLFGWSWRTFAVKRRNVSQIRMDPHDKTTVLARVENSSNADGFQPGDSVLLLGPQRVGTAPDAPERILGTATIGERGERGATVHIVGHDLESVKTACASPKPSRSSDPHPWITGCQVATTQSAQILSESDAMRMPAWVFTGILIALLYLFGTALYGRWVGLIAALVMLFVPRHFFHAHLCAFDMPVVTMILATVYAYWRSLRSDGWAVATGVIWALALLTKHNAFFVPIPLVLAWLAASPPQITRAGPTPDTVRLWIGRLAWLPALLLTGWLTSRGTAIGVGLIVLIVGLSWTGTRIQFPPLPKAFLWMPTLGLVIYFLLWPWLWYDTAQSFHTYFTFHWDHVHYLQQYFGTILEVPPFPVAFPLALTGLTVPIPVLALFLFGATILFWRHRDQTEIHDRWLIGVNLAFPIVLIALPTTPVFGGVKHWLTAMPFFALIAGVGFDWFRRGLIHRWIENRAIRVALTTALMALLLGSSVVDSLQFRQHGTAYYNRLAGGVSGAADLKMHRQFWGYSGRYGLAYVNQHARRNARVAFHNTTYDAVTFYKRDGELRHDIHWQRDPPLRCSPQSTLYLFHHQESFAQEEIEAWNRMNTWTPVEVHSADGVPMLSIYECSSGTVADKM